MRTALLAVASFLLATVAVQADGIEVRDAYARSASPVAKSGAVFMVLENTGPEDDRLIGVETPAAARAELHTHISDDTGVMRMREVENGFAVPAGGAHALSRGGDHVMLMGLTAPLEQGTTIPLTLTFERAGDITLDVTVDSARAPQGHGG